MCFSSFFLHGVSDILHWLPSWSLGHRRRRRHSWLRFMPLPPPSAIILTNEKEKKKPWKPIRIPFVPIHQSNRCFFSPFAERSDSIRLMLLSSPLSLSEIDEISFFHNIFSPPIYWFLSSFFLFRPTGERMCSPWRQRSRSAASTVHSQFLLEAYVISSSFSLSLFFFFGWAPGTCRYSMLECRMFID